MLNKHQRFGGTCCFHLHGVVNLKLYPCVISEALCHEGVWGSGGIAPSFSTSTLDAGKWSASRSGRSSSGLSCRYPLNWRLSGPQSRSGRPGVEKHVLHLPGIEKDYNLVAVYQSIWRHNPEDHTFNILSL
jgi:hypothetical protein